MKQTDGLFHKVFDEIAREYPEIKSDHWIIDIGTARLADTPEVFDVIVTPNLYGDVISDVAAQISGSVGLAGSANIGESFAMFEAIHGSAPDIAGKNMANPSGLLQGAVMMLNHIGQPRIAEKIQNAWLTTIEERVHTFDLFDEHAGSRLVGTREFAEAVIANLGRNPSVLRPASFGNNGPLKLPAYKRKPKKKKDLLGVDLFVQWSETNPEQLANMVGGISLPGLELSMITNRGIKVWPDGFPETFCTDHWRCRFKGTDGTAVPKNAVVELMNRALQQDIDVIKSENLYAFDGAPAFSAGQGQ